MAEVGMNIFVLSVAVAVLGVIVGPTEINGAGGIWFISRW